MIQNKRKIDNCKDMLLYLDQEIICNEEKCQKLTKVLKK